jgi:hypothetical protein
MVSLAPRLADRRVWIVATGAPGDGMAAIAALVDEHPRELAGAAWLNLVDGGVSDTVAVSEEGAWRERRSDRWLLDAAEEAGAEVRPYRFATCATPLLARRRRALTLLVPEEPDGEAIALAVATAALEGPSAGARG